jgi:hypothetical protein
MQQRTKPGELQLLISRLPKKRNMLRVFELPFTIEATTGLLFPRRRRENLRPKLQGLRQSLEAVNEEQFASGKTNAIIMCIGVDRWDRCFM